MLFCTFFYHLHSDILVWNDNLKMTAEILVLLNKKQSFVNLTSANN